jgi:hypothetical protein
MDDTEEKELRMLNAVCKRIIKSFGNEPPHIALSALTTVMASIIVNNESPHTDEEILRTANETLKASIKRARRVQIKAMTQH